MEDVITMVGAGYILNYTRALWTVHLGDELFPYMETIGGVCVYKDMS